MNDKEWAIKAKEMLEKNDMSSVICNDEATLYVSNCYFNRERLRNIALATLRLEASVRDYLVKELLKSKE